MKTMQKFAPRLRGFSTLRAPAAAVYRFLAKETQKPVWGIPATSRDGMAFHPMINVKEFEESPCVAGVFDNNVSLEAERLLAPLAPRYPPAAFVIGLNYAKHAAETGFPEPKYPIATMKNPATISGPNDSIVLPKVARDEVDFEVELAIVIGKTTRDVSEADALNFVAGYTCVNDVSARKWQGKKGGGQWVRAKSFDTFMPIGPCLRRSDDSFDPNNAKLQTVLSGQVMQDSNTNDMIFNVQKLVSFLSQGTTLLPWTLILTGTPEGVGYTRDPPRLLKPGDEVTVSVEGIGELTNPVV